MPRPPEYCGSAAVMPYSGEKYATARGPSPAGPRVAYQRGPDRYSRRSRSASCSRDRKAASAASAALLAEGSADSIALGSHPDAAQAAGSIEENSAAAGACQDQRRFSISPCSGASGSGRVTRTVNRRIALTGVTLADAAPWPAPDGGDRGGPGVPSGLRPPGKLQS